MKKAFRKALSILLVAVMLVSSAPLAGFVGLELPDWLNFAIEAKAMNYSGTCGKNVTYSFDSSTGILEINGNGKMNDYSGFAAPWYSYHSDIKNIVIANGVTSVGDYSFADCRNLLNIILPESIVNIGAFAFWCCSDISNISLPNNITTIGECAFICVTIFPLL